MGSQVPGFHRTSQVFKPGDIAKVRSNACIETVFEDERQSEMQWTSKSHIGIVINRSYRLVESLETTVPTYIVFISDLGRLFVIIEHDLLDIDAKEDVWNPLVYPL